MSTSACTVLLLGQEGMGQLLMLPGSWGKEGITAKFLHTNSNAQTPQITRFQALYGETPAAFCSLRCNCRLHCFKPIFEFLYQSLELGSVNYLPLNLFPYISDHWFDRRDD